jgi:hypothetical protein
MGPRRLCVSEIRLRATTWRPAAARIIVKRASDLLALIWPGNTGRERRRK